MAARLIDIAVFFMWDGVSYTEETANLISANGTLEMVAPGESFLSSKQVIQRASITLANNALRYSIENASSPIYAYIADGALYQRKCQIRFKEGAGGSWENVFTGYIKLPTYDYVRNTVTFAVWDIGEILRQKFSTGMLQDYLEHEIVAYYLALAGLTDGVDYISPAYADANPGTTETIEYSTTPVPFSWLDDEPVVSEIVDIAQSSGSRFYVDQDGLVHYERNTFWLGAPGYTPETLDATNLGEFTTQYDDKAFYDAITVEYTEREPGAGSEELWKLQKPKTILAGQSETIVARYRYPAVSVDAPVANETYFITDVNGNDVSGSVTFNVDLSNAQQGEITIDNITAATVVLSQMSLYGVALHGQPSEQYTADAGGSYGRRIDVRGNPYLLTRLQAQRVADFLAWWYGALKLLLPLSNIPGKANRGLGRRVTVEWYDRGSDTTYSYDAIIMQCQWRINVDPRSGALQYSQNLTALEDVFTGNYFIIGTSAFGDGSQLWF